MGRYPDAVLGGGERLALLVTESRRDAIESVELAEQETCKPILLALLQELLDEANPRALLLAGAGLFFSYFGHAGGPVASC